MYKFSVGGTLYSVKFTYGSLYKSDIIDRVIKASVPSTEDVDGFVAFTKNMLGMTAELLLEGLQKCHSDKFGYDTPEEREKRILEVCDLIDDYEEENTDENGERQKDGFTLYTDLQAELEKNGFLSQILTLMNTAGEAEETEQTESKVVLQDHKKKARGGQNK